MRIGNLALGAVLASIAALGAAHAQDLAAAQATAPPIPTTNTFTPAGVPQTLAGARINRFVGVEAEVFPREARDLSQAALRDLERDRRPVTFGVAYLPVSPKAEVFARVGYGGSRTSLSGRQDDGWKYGAGAQYRLNDRNGLRADYTRQGRPRSDVKANIFSLGFVKRF